MEHPRKYTQLDKEKIKNELKYAYHTDPDFRKMVKFLAVNQEPLEYLMENKLHILCAIYIFKREKEDMYLEKGNGFRITCMKCGRELELKDSSCLKNNKEINIDQEIECSCSNKISKGG